MPGAGVLEPRNATGPVKAGPGLPWERRDYSSFGLSAQASACRWAQFTWRLDRCSASGVLGKSHLVAPLSQALGQLRNGANTPVPRSRASITSSGRATDSSAVEGTPSMVSAARTRRPRRRCRILQAAAARRPAAPSGARAPRQSGPRPVAHHPPARWSSERAAQRKQLFSPRIITAWRNEVISHDRPKPDELMKRSRLGQGGVFLQQVFDFGRAGLFAHQVDAG